MSNKENIYEYNVRFKMRSGGMEFAGDFRDKKERILMEGVCILMNRLLDHQEKYDIKNVKIRLIIDFLESMKRLLIHITAMMNSHITNAIREIEKMTESSIMDIGGVELQFKRSEDAIENMKGSDDDIMMRKKELDSAMKEILERLRREEKERNNDAHPK